MNNNRVTWLSTTDPPEVFPPVIEAHSDPNAIVWDADPISPDRCDELRRLHAAHPHAVIIAISTMAHPEDIEVLSACGAVDVVPKLHFAEMLPRSLQAALTMSGTSAD